MIAHKTLAISIITWCESAPLMKFENRQAGEVFAVEVQHIEGEIGKDAKAGVRGLLHQFERSHIVLADAAALAVDLGGRDQELGERLASTG